MPAELKWLFVFIFAIIGLFAVALGTNAYIDHTCKIEALKAGKPTDDIVRICR
jgi:hypothetical protein